MLAVECKCELGHEMLLDSQRPLVCEEITPLASVRHQRGGVLHVPRRQASIAEGVGADTGDATPVLEAERGEVAAPREGGAVNEQDALGDDNLPETTAGEAVVPDVLQPRARLEDDLVQPLAIRELEHPEPTDAFWNHELFYVAALEPEIVHDLEPVREAEDPGHLLVESELLGRHLHPRRNLELSDGSVPEAEPVELLNGSV